MFIKGIKEFFKLLFIEKPLTPNQIDSILIRRILIYKIINEKRISF